MREKDTLVELIGKKAHAVMKEHCDHRVAVLKTIKKLPGRQAKEILLSLNPHPADRFI